MLSRPLAISLLICLLHFPSSSNAQHVWAAFFPNKYGSAGGLTWRWNEPPTSYSFDRLPAITVNGENGGVAFFLGTDSKGSYLSLRGKILFWDGEHLTPVAKLPDHMVSKNVLDIVIDHPFDANATRNEMSGRLDYKYRFRGGDPFLPFPCGKVGNISWAYGAGCSPAMPSFPLVWVEGNEQHLVYYGFNSQGSYLWDIKSSKLLKWDGKTMTEIAALPDFFVWSRNSYILTFNVTPLLARNFGAANQPGKPGGPNGDPYFPMRGNQDVSGRWGIASGISWYYPLQQPQTIPIITLHTKGGDVQASYQGYHAMGAYLLVKGKPMLWDGDNLTSIDQIPPAASLLNAATANSGGMGPTASGATAGAGTAGGDPYFVKGGTGNGMISWEYAPNDNYPTLYMGMRGKSLQIKGQYRGYDEHGAYFTWDDPLIGTCQLMFDGRGNIIPVGKIPGDLKNPH
jgi:hypothetical protein